MLRVRWMRPRTGNGRPIDCKGPVVAARGGSPVPAGVRLAVPPGDLGAVRRYAVSALQDLGYQVLQAADGASALALLAQAAPGRLDLLFTDVVMPGGMSGPALAEQFSARFPGMPVLFATGYTRDAIDAAVPVLAKPYDLDSLAKSVRRAIDR